MNYEIDIKLKGTISLKLIIVLAVGGISLLGTTLTRRYHQPPEPLTWMQSSKPPAKFYSPSGKTKSVRSPKKLFFVIALKIAIALNGYSRSKRTTVNSRRSLSKTPWGQDGEHSLEQASWEYQPSP